MGKKQSKLEAVNDALDTTAAPWMMVAIVGNSGVGKTSIVQSWFTGALDDPCTYGSSRNPDDGVVHSNKTSEFKFLVRDSSGARFQCSFYLCFFGSLNIFAYDLSDTPQNLIVQAKYWIGIFFRYLCGPRNKTHNFVFLGNKSDQENPETRRVGEALARLFDMSHYTVSAKCNPEQLSKVMLEMSNDTFARETAKTEHAFCSLQWPPDAMFDSI